jgi:hypothetical protein
MKYKVLLISAIVLAFVGTVANASITIPWQTNQYGTYQEWTFENPNNQTQTGPNTWRSIPENTNNPGAHAHIWALELCPGTAMQLGWNAMDMIGTLGVYYGDNWHNPAASGLTFKAWIPNTEIEPLKIIQIEWVYSGTQINGGLTVPTGHTYGLISDSGPISGNDGYWERTVTMWISPQPEWEVVYLGFNGSGGFLDSVQIATICVPAPGAILLTGIGTGLVGWLRRRKALA